MRSLPIQSRKSNILYDIVEVDDEPILSLRNWRGDCTDVPIDGSRRYDPLGTFPRLSILSAVW